MIEEIPFERFIWDTVDDYPGIPVYWERRFPGFDAIVYEILADTSAGREIDEEKMATAAREMKEFNEKLKVAQGRASCSEEIAPREIFEYNTKEDYERLTGRDISELEVSELQDQQ